MTSSNDGECGRRDELPLMLCSGNSTTGGVPNFELASSVPDRVGRCRAAARGTRAICAVNARRPFTYAGIMPARFVEVASLADVSDRFLPRVYAFDRNVSTVIQSIFSQSRSRYVLLASVLVFIVRLILVRLTARRCVREFGHAHLS